MRDAEGVLSLPPLPFNSIPVKKIREMKTYLKAGAVRTVMFLLTIVCALGVNAQNSLTIGKVALNNAEPQKVAIYLDNEDPVAAMQFDVVTPEGIDIVGDFERNDARFTEGQTSNYRVHNPHLSRLIVVSHNKNNFVGNSGLLGYITVQATPEALNQWIEGSIKLENIMLGTATGGKLESNKTSENTATVCDAVVSLSTVAPFEITQGGQQVVSLSAEQTFNVSSFQGVIALPEGFTILNDKIVKGERLSNGAAVQLTPRGNGEYAIVVYDLMVTPGGNGIVNGNSGELFSFTVVAPEDFEPGTAQIEFRDFEFANMDPRTVSAASVSVEMTVKEAFTPGDFDGDGIGMTDVMRLLNIIASGTLTPEEKKIADVNGDGVVNILDVQKLLVIWFNSDEPAQARAKYYVPVDMKALIGGMEIANENGVRTIAIELKNNGEFIGGEFGIKLPAGMHIISERFGDRAEGMAAATADLSDGTHRVAFISTEMKAIEGNDGALYVIEVIGSGDVTVEDALFTDRYGNACYGTAPGTTGIDSIFDNFTNGSSHIYGVDGRQMNEMQRGINIIVNSNGKSSKVLKK